MLRFRISLSGTLRLAPCEAVTPQAGVHALSAGLDARPTPSRGQALRGNDGGKLTLGGFSRKMNLGRCSLVLARARVA